MKLDKSANRVPLPQDCFLRKLESLGVHNGRKTYRDSEAKRLYQWDDLHGHVEVYSLKGLHLAVVNSNNERLSAGVKGRKIDVN